MRGQTILITGGSGTLGTAFTRYALEQGADRVICLSRGEHRQAELQRGIDDSRLECWLGDVRDPARLEWAFASQPDVVIHAAALKRVESCENDPDEAIATNIDGTRNVVKAAMAAGIPKVLVISSDKGCSPETVYGTTKAAAEAAAIGQNRYRGNGLTRISVVRYGNVLGSQGSFLETLIRCRETGDPVPITDPRATRFWWSVEDAVRFVGSVLERMQGCEVWVPKLASAPVVELAKLVAPASRIDLIGMRGPEKVHEAMVNETESAYTYELPDCYVLYPKQGQWWSPAPAEGAIPVATDFCYTSRYSVQPEAALARLIERAREPLCASV